MTLLNAGATTNPVLAKTLARYPDSQVLFDDTFENGFAGWQELNVGSGIPSSAPLSLSHPSVPGPVLATATRSARDQGYHSQGIAMKRVTHMEAPKIVDFELWFAWGGESTTGHSPHFIQFMIDEMYGGQRHFWKARWRNTDEGGTRPKNWYLSSANEDAYVDTGLVSDLPWNGNKGSVCRVKLSVDVGNLRYAALEANSDRFNLSGVAVTPPQNASDPNFNDPLFNNGLNFMFCVINRSNQDLMSWMAVRRARGTIRSA